MLNSAINIRDDERKLMALFVPHGPANYKLLKLPALQWLCKRCLRALTELAVSKTRKHARDLVPCFELCSSAYPEHADLFLTALQVACAHKGNRFVGLGHEEILRVGLETARDLVEVVEDVFLKKTYGSNHESLVSNELQTPPVRPPKFQALALQAVERTINGTLFHVRRSPIRTSDFLESHLPKLAIEQFGQVKEKAFQKKIPGSGINPSDYLAVSDEPFIVRDVMNVKGLQSLLTSFVRNHPTVSCRISPTNIVTFCRSEHPWVKDKLFTPPSILHSISTTEAIRRLKADCSSAPLIYSDSSREHLYIQTDALSSERLFDLGRHRNLQVVQTERIWISTHGTVSSLHYDTSHSALLQMCGRKRMLFFPPECMDRLGIYPLGHPLHRRARVRLDHSKSNVFRRFWTECSSFAKEAVVGPGDMIVFPPNWSHYTESIASNSELSISRTLRYICLPHLRNPLS
ncbi:Cupin-like domain containing protein [Gracilaria domingensis]|nr:Cupin-like domain containing protein [Gracilaria domingensis]